uniref:ATP synthase subunit a n=1 Tax=Dinocampus coccinellae TaxID=144245 RepID=A0A343YVC6_9HYME|nr:ATP synthase F0 subunit 6 [Dinocampus coccinellae]
MLNLFTVFDPCAGGVALNWNSTFIGLILLPQIYWIYMSRYNKIFISLFKMLFMDFLMILHSKFNILNIIFFIILFMYIVFNNFMGLFPYIFTSSSHMVFSLLFSLSMWLGLMFFGWLFNNKFMFAHLVPLGTPFLLMFFMVLIESLSNIIRPLTLSIRLVANMVAGHLLLTLLSMFIPSNFLYLFLLMVQILLMILEIGVSLIQSYVFVVLMILYLKETNYGYE